MQQETNQNIIKKTTIKGNQFNGTERIDEILPDMEILNIIDPSSANST